MRQPVFVMLRAVAVAVLAAATAVALAVATAPAASAVVQGGTCTGFPGAEPLGASYTDSVVTVPACGPQPGYTSGPAVSPYPGARTNPGYQCAEFSVRYLHYRFGVNILGSTDGDQVVDHYASWYPTKFSVIANGAAGHAPVKGDVISFASSGSFNGSDGGHTAVVQSSSVNSSGNGSILIIEQNGGAAAANGSQTLTVSNWRISYNPHPYIKWLHPKAITLPAQPASPHVTSTTGTSAHLVWTDKATNEDSYRIQYRIGSGKWAAGPTLGVDATSGTVTGLQRGTRYTFQVGAHNAKGTHWSVYFYGTTVALPAQPGSPKVTATTGTTATLSWVDASNNETSFVSQYKTGTGAWVAGPAVGAGVQTMRITGLHPATSYTFQIGARNAAGTHWSAYATGKTPQVLPAQPGSPRVTATSGTTATLAWVDASNNETSFVTQYKIGSGSWKGGPAVGAGVTSVTVTGLARGTRYTFQIGARNSVGTHWSAYCYGTTVALPAQPDSPKVVAVTNSSATLTWTDASNNETSFVSQYKTGTGAWVAGPTVGAGVQSMTIGGLHPSTSYTFQIGAHNSAGTHWSAYATRSTAAAPPPPSGYHTGRQVKIDSHATGGVSGHDGPSNAYAAGPTRPANSALWIVCYVNGQSITGPYNTTTIWDLSDDGYYYTDAWLYTGTNSAAVPPCAPKTVKIDSHATGGVSGHRGPDNSYATGPTHAANTTITIFCYVTGQSITGPYNTTTIWDLSDDGYYYTDAWLYTGTNGAAVPHC